MLYSHQLNKEVKQMLLNFNRFYKVIVVKIEVFGSRIVDERHFSTLKSAESYANTITDNNSVVVATMYPQ